MEENKSNVTINIQGGNNQILPNATHAVQYFYGDKFAHEKQIEKAENIISDSNRGNSRSESISEEATKRLSIYISESEQLLYYIEKLKVCTTAAELAKVAMEIYKTPEIESVDKEEVVKARFIETILALCPKLTKGNSISNIRIQINELLMKR